MHATHINRTVMQTNFTEVIVPIIVYGRGMVEERRCLTGSGRAAITIEDFRNDTSLPIITCQYTMIGTDIDLDGLPNPILAPIPRIIRWIIRDAAVRHDTCPLLIWLASSGACAGVASRTAPRARYGYDTASDKLDQ
jgi:hypothetical protein